MDVDQQPARAAAIVVHPVFDLFVGQVRTSGSARVRYIFRAIGDMVGDQDGKDCEPQGAMRVLLVDDHSLLRQAIKEVIESHFPSSVVRETSTGKDAIRIVRAEPVEMAILDIGLPDSNGLTVMKQIKQVRPSLKCLVLTMHDAAQYARLAMLHGASGYLSKAADPRELSGAIRTILSDRQVVRGPFRELIDRRTKRPVAIWPHEFLSVRELEVLSLLARGHTASQIAKQSRLSVKTVIAHRTRLLEKLHLGTTTDLIRYAVNHQLVR